MRLADAISKVAMPTLSLPGLGRLAAAAERVRKRWPDVRITPVEHEREALACKLRDRVNKDDWDGALVSFVVAATSAVFDRERRDRPDLAGVRAFLYAEGAASTSETFLAGLLRAYLESYAPRQAHTLALAKTLTGATARMGMASRLLLDAVPELLDPTSGPERLARRMADMGDPYAQLERFGLRNPHGPGFMDLAHLVLTARVRPELALRKRIDWYVNWLRPPGKAEARSTGAEVAIEALLAPWVATAPDDTLRAHLVETLVELYGDPRIKSGGVWVGVGEREKATICRWLTREDLRFFTGVVDAAQLDAMWARRRDFWLKLYAEGLIDAAWAALSSEALVYARKHLMREGARNADTRVGVQKARGGRKNTSLLILRVGDKIMVEGCHNFRTHVFDSRDPMAPKLFQSTYDCEEIMRVSDERKPPAAKGHNGIESWGRWVRDMINADVSWCRQPGTRGRGRDAVRPR